MLSTKIYFFLAQYKIVSFNMGIPQLLSDVLKKLTIHFITLLKHC